MSAETTWESNQQLESASRRFILFTAPSLEWQRVPAGASPLLAAGCSAQTKPVLAGRAPQLGHASFQSHALQPFKLA